ncbi:MAG: O-antigen ligase family protein [Bdellovibrionales bacterium]|nr:O-antigen ligase family protein [Bdellovibrionales bacterium]
MRGFSALRWGVLVGLPLVVFPIGDSVREPKLFAMIGLSFVALVTLWRRRKTTRRWPVYVLAFSAYATANSLVLFPSLVPLLALWCGLLLALETAAAVQENPRHTRLLLEGLTWFLLGFSLLQQLEMDPVFRHDVPFLHRLPTGFMGQHTLHAAFLAVCASFHLAGRRWWPLAAALGTMFLAKSTMAALGFLAALGFWVWLHPHWRRRAAAGGTLALGTAGAWLWWHGGFLQDSGRLEVWRKTAELAWEKPLLGHGFHSFQEIFPRVYLSSTNHYWQQAHNEILQVFFELGAVGVLLLSLILAELWDSLSSFPRRQDALSSPALPWALVTVCLMVNSLGSFPWHMPPLAMLGTVGFFVVTLTLCHPSRMR